MLRTLKVFFYPFKQFLIQKYFFIFLVLFPLKIYADVSIQTLDSWNIDSYSPDALMVMKQSENNDNYLAFEMNRPFCICKQLSFVMYEDNKFEERQLVEGRLSFNFHRTKKVTYKIMHAEKDWYVLGLESFPSIRNAEHIEIESPHFKDSFIITGLEEVMEQSKKMCESYIEYEYAEAQEIDV